MSTTEGKGSRIVVGVDGSDASKDAVRWAVRQAQLTGASLDAIMAWHVPSTVYGAIPVPNDFDFSAGAAEVLDATLAETVGPHDDVVVKKTVIEGPAALKLLDAARGADLLVLGSRGHGAFSGMLLGSVSEHCVSHASCPVVVVRHTADPA